MEPHDHDHDDPGDHEDPGDHHEHAHEVGHGHGHSHGRPPTGRGMVVAVVLNAGLAVVQIVGGILFSSVAMFADAGHQAIDAAGLLLGWGALRLARRPATSRRTWGWGRADALGAQVSAFVLIVSLLWVVYESSLRLVHPEHVVGLGVVAAGLVGIVVNGGSLGVIGRSSDHLSVRAARLHLLTDLAGSVALVIVGVVARWTGWDRIDPITSLVLSASLAWSAVALLRESSGVLLDVAPAHLDVDALVDAVRAEVGVVSLHHVHVWTVAPGVTALSAHVDVDGDLTVHAAQHELRRVEEVVRLRYGIGHTTLQLECHPCDAPSHEIGGTH